MSVKSQKSLYEECPEKFERSYSLKSLSDDSFTSDDEDEALAKELMNKLTPAVLSKLRRCFKKSKERNTATEIIDRKVEQVMRAAAAEEGIEFPEPAAPPQDSLWLDEGGFQAAMNDIFGPHKYSPHTSRLFRMLDPFNKGRVWWRHLVARLVLNGTKRTTSRRDKWTPATEGQCIKLAHCQREMIVKLVNIERVDSFCYVAVSKGGRVGVYSGDMKILHTYEIFYHRTGLRRRVKNCWITDAIYLSDVQYLMYSASDRSLTIYDAATLCHAPMYCVTGIPNIPTCLAYSPSPSALFSSELAMGSERGDVMRVTFHQPRVQFMHTGTPEAINHYFWMELSSPPHSCYVSVTRWRHVHSRAVRRVTFAGDGDILLSCSLDSDVSMRLRHVTGKLDDYVFKVFRGVSCFAWAPPVGLATGGRDGAVRLWERTQATPFALLRCPGAPHVLDVALLAHKEIVLAHCANCVVHIWDLYEECLLQSIKVKFPFLGVLGKKVEFGIYSIHPGPAREPIPEEIPDEGVKSLRRSSVVQRSTGGLSLLPESKSDTLDGTSRNMECHRFTGSEVIITCCDYLCPISLGETRGRPRPPPGHSLHPRGPSAWRPPNPPKSPQPHLSAKGTPISSSYQSPRGSAQYLSPKSAEEPLQDLDTLVKNTGLEGILEKDFTLGQGLKHDLNKKLAQMEADKDALTAAVNVGAPYLGLKTFEPEAVFPVDEMTEQYRRIMKLFPGPSVSGTPRGSQASTPRQSKQSKL